MTESQLHLRHIWKKQNGLIATAVPIHWTGLLDWTTGLDYWTYPNCHKIPYYSGKDWN